MTSRRLEFRIPGDGDEEATLPFSALVEFGKQFDRALQVQSNRPTVGVSLTFFGPGGSTVLRLSAPEIEGSDATDIVIQACRGAAGGRVAALRPQAAAAVRAALTALVDVVPDISVRDGWRTPDGGWVPIDRDVLEALDEQAQRPERTMPTMRLFRIVGFLGEIDATRARLQVQPKDCNAYRFEYSRSSFKAIDSGRWRRVVAIALPLPRSPLAFELQRINKARRSDVDGIVVEGSEPDRRRLLASLERLTRDRSLKKPGWDGYRAKPLDKETVAAARRWLLGAQATLLLQDVDLPTPSAVGTRSGGVQFEWRRDAAVLEVEFEDGGRIVTLHATPSGDREGEKSFNSAWEQLAAFITS